MVEANTVFSKKETIELNKFQLFVRGRIYLIIFMLWFITLGLMLLFIGISAVAKLIGVIFIVLFGLGFPAFCWFAIRLLIELQLRTSRVISEETNNYYKIDEDNLFNRLTKTGCEATFEAKWNLVYKAYETKTHFFIYLNHVQAFVISKAGIFTGTPEELSEMLLKALGKNFIKGRFGTKSAALPEKSTELDT